MFNRELSKVVLFVFVVSICLYSDFVLAKDNTNIKELKKQIGTLQKRVEQLESEKVHTDDKDNISSPSGVGFLWDPWDEMQRMQSAMDRMFQNSFGRSGMDTGMFSSNMKFNYNVDVNETDKGYEIKFDMEELDEGKMDFQINEHSLTIKGERSQENSEESPNKLISRKSLGSFMKTIPLPPDADTTKVQTEKKGDTLIIRLPKK